MYFTNIANKELAYFHGLQVPNFSISLTEMLTSGLFKIETIITDKLYRIYPLFYTNEITSSNGDDKILDTKCIIATKKDTETYYNFIKTHDEPIAIYNNELNFFEIGDKLTMDNFNAIVQLYRSKNPFSEEINIVNSKVDGSYGSYIFNLESSTIVDNGVLITKETLESIGTVRLVEPVFRYSSYTLHMRVYSVDDFNIDLANRNNIVVTDLSIPLTEDVDVTIPFETLDLNNIVGFNASVSIDHDKNFIYSDKHVLLDVTGSGYVGEPLTFHGEYVSDDGSVLDGETITLYDGETSLGSCVTDTNGEFEFTYTPMVVKQFSFIGVSDEWVVSDSVIVDVIKHSSNCTCTSQSLVFIPGSFTVSGVLLSDGVPVSNAGVVLYNGNTVFDDSLVTDANGLFSRVVSVDSVENFNFSVKYLGSSLISGCESNYVNVTARKLNGSLSITTDKSTVYYSQSLVVSGILTDELNNKITGATVKLFNRDTQIATGTTNSNGAFSFNRNWSQGNYQFKVVYDGDDRHNNSTSAVKNVSMVKAPTSISIVNQGSYAPNDNILIRVNSNYGNINPSSVTVTFDSVQSSISTKDGQGNFVYTLPSRVTGSYILSVAYAGDGNYTSSTGSANISMVNNLVSITAIKSGSNVAFTCKNAGGDGIANLNLDKIMIYDNSKWMTFTGDFITNSNGVFEIGVGFTPRGKAYAVYGNITSNTVTW